MSRIALSNTGSWKLKFGDQDVRGYRALDKDGTPVGTVDTMVVNTDEKRVDAILLEDGTEYPARDLSIGDGVVYLTTLDEDHEAAESVTVYDDYGHVVEREAVADADYNAHVDAFRTHHSSTYGDTDYTDYEPAYKYGYETAYSEDYKDRSYHDAEPDLKSGYLARYGDRDYDRDRDAVRYGYTRAQHGVR